MNDALLSGSVDFVCLGIPGIATIWGKTKGGLEVKAASGFNFLPLQLNTRNPNIKSMRDLTDKDKIALPAVKVSMQAIILQMAAAQAFGEANYTKLDASRCRWRIRTPWPRSCPAAARSTTISRRRRSSRRNWRSRASPRC